MYAVELVLRPARPVLLYGLLTVAHGACETMLNTSMPKMELVPAKLNRFRSYTLHGDDRQDPDNSSNFLEGSLTLRGPFETPCAFVW